MWLWQTQWQATQIALLAVAAAAGKCCWQAAFSHQPSVTCSSCRDPPLPVTHNRDWSRWIYKGWTIRTALMGRFDSRAPFGSAMAVTGPAWQLDFSLCPILLPSPPSTGCLFQPLFLKKSYMLNSESIPRRIQSVTAMVGKNDWHVTCPMLTKKDSGPAHSISSPEKNPINM